MQILLVKKININSNNNPSFNLFCYDASNSDQLTNGDFGHQYQAKKKHVSKLCVNSWPLLERENPITEYNNNSIFG